MAFREKNPKLFIFLAIIVLGSIWNRCRHLIRGKKSLKNKVILITGGVSGIGRLTALLCKKKGGIVVVWDINDAGLKEMESNVDLSMKCDVTSKAMVDECAQKVLKQFGSVDILINNAGIVIGKSLLELNENQIKKCFEVNIISQFWTVKAFLPSMLEKKSGHIVTIGSTAGRVGCAYLSDYCATKFACRGLDDAINMELLEFGQRTGIYTTLIQPYFIDTGMFDGAIDSRSVILRYLCGCEFLKPDYVASEIIRAIQYNIRHLVIPKRLSVIMSLEHALPIGLKEFLLSQGPSMAHFTGRSNQPR